MHATHDRRRTGHDACPDSGGNSLPAPPLGCASSRCPAGPGSSRSRQLRLSRHRRRRDGVHSRRGEGRSTSHSNTHSLFQQSRWRHVPHPCASASAVLDGVAVHIPGRNAPAPTSRPGGPSVFSTSPWPAALPSVNPSPPTSHTEHPPNPHPHPLNFPPTESPCPLTGDSSSASTRDGLFVRLILSPFFSRLPRRASREPAHSSGYFGSRRFARESARSTTVLTSPS